MIHRRSFVSLALVLVSLASLPMLQGCGDANADIVGTYELDKEAMRAAMKAEMEKESEGDDAGMEDMAMTMLLGMLDSMEIALTLNADGTATMHMTAMGDTQEDHGTWTRDGDTLTITPNADAEAMEAGTAIIDGDVLRIQPASNDQGQMPVLLRKRAG